MSNTNANLHKFLHLDDAALNAAIERIALLVKQQQRELHLMRMEQRRRKSVRK